MFIVHFNLCYICQYQDFKGRDGGKEAEKVRDRGKVEKTTMYMFKSNEVKSFICDTDLA